MVCAPCSRFEGPAFGYATVQRMCTSCYDAPSPFVALTESDIIHHHENQHHQNKPHRAAGTTRNQDDENDNNNDNNQSKNNNFATFDYYNLHENPSDEDDDDENNNKRRKIDDDDNGENFNSSSSDDDDDEDDDEVESSLDLESTSTFSRSFFSKNNNNGSGNAKGNDGRIEDPRVVFAPWAHLVLNSEPNTVYKQPWYETINEHVVEDVLSRIRGMIQQERNKFLDESSSNVRVIPRAEYVVRQPGYLEEADKEIEDAAIGEDYPSEFDPDE